MHKLQKLLHALGISQKDFAKSIGITGAAITEIVKGRSKGLSEQTLLAIVQRYNVNPVWLLTGEGEMFLPGKEPAAPQPESNTVQGYTLKTSDGQSIKKHAADKVTKRLNGLDGGAEEYPQVDDIEKLIRTKWYKDKSKVKQYIAVALDELDDPALLEKVKNIMAAGVDKQQASRRIEEELKAVVDDMMKKAPLQKKGQAG